jgi:hypothetical protein
MSITRKHIALAAVVGALGLTPVALADATTSVYDGPGKSTQKAIGTLTPPTQTKGVKPVSQTIAKTSSAAPVVGALPFTGMDLGFVALAGAALAGMGFSLRRLARDTDR